jgi:putative copper export protein
MAMQLNDVLHWFHLLAAAVWVGGMITMGAVVQAARSADVSRDQLRSMARRFGALSWAAMALAVVTGVAQVFRLDVDLTAPFAIKLILVSLVVALAFAHREIARGASPAVRGAMEAVLLLLSLGILAAAVAV